MSSHCARSFSDSNVFESFCLWLLSVVPFSKFKHSRYDHLQWRWCDVKTNRVLPPSLVLRSKLQRTYCLPVLPPFLFLKIFLSIKDESIYLINQIHLSQLHFLSSSSYIIKYHAFRMILTKLGLMLMLILNISWCPYVFIKH